MPEQSKGGPRGPSHIKVLTCPGCNAPLGITSPKTQTLSCAACGSVIDASSEAGRILASTSPQGYPPRTFIRLGMIGSLGATHFQVIGRMSYYCSINEWDDEDNCYCADTWSYDEWILGGENKEYLYLDEDEEGYFLARPFTPTSPKIPNHGEDYFSLDKEISPQRIREQGTARLVHFEGEFTYLPEIGEETHYAEYVIGETIFSVEWRYKESKEQIEEVEFFSAKPISRLELLTAFGLEREAEEEKDKQAASEEYTRWGMAFAGAGVFCLCMCLIFFIQPQAKVFEQTVWLNNTSGDGLIVGPFPLSERGSVYRINLQTSIPDNSEVWAGVELLDEQQEMINAVDYDFWRESGYDSDGHWSESDTSHDFPFRLESPGLYYARVFLDEASAKSASLRVSIFKGVALIRYYLIAAFVCFGYAYSLHKKQSLNPGHMLLGLLTLGYLILQRFDDD